MGTDIIKTNKNNYKNIADAIREKLNTEEKFAPSQMAGKILSIQNLMGEKTITENGEYTPDDDNIDGYNKVIVNVGSLNQSIMGEKTITQNGEYTPDDDNLDGYNKVIVNVESTSQSSSNNISNNSLNIAYGDIPPEDKTKLWIKGEPSSKVTISPKNFGIDEIINVNTINRQVNDINGNSVTIDMDDIFCYEAFENKIYLFYNNCLVIYNTETNEYSYNTNIQIGKIICPSYNKRTLGNPTAWGRINNKIYFFGFDGGYYWGISKLIYVYDIDENTLTLLVDCEMPISIKEMGTVIKDNYIYLFGGTIYDGWEPLTIKSVYVFDTQSYTITQLNDLPYEIAGLKEAYFGDSLYLMGGFTYQYIEGSDGAYTRVYAGKRLRLNNLSNTSYYLFDATDFDREVDPQMSRVFGKVSFATLNNKTYFYFNAGRDDLWYICDFLYSYEEFYDEEADDTYYIYNEIYQGGNNLAATTPVIVATNNKIYLINRHHSPFYYGSSYVNNIDYISQEFPQLLKNNIYIKIVSPNLISKYPYPDTDTLYWTPFNSESSLKMELTIQKIYRGNSENVAELENNVYLYNINRKMWINIFNANVTYNES